MENNTGNKQQEIKPKFATTVPDVWKKLGELKRTGWVNRGVKNPETVQEHTLALMQIASTFDWLNEKDKGDLVDMLEIHDWPEAILGDEVILSYDENELKSLEKYKSEREESAMKSICESLGVVGDEIKNLWIRFEKSEDEIASFARQIDKYQAIEKSLEYEMSQGVIIFKEILEYSRKRIIHPVLIEKLRELESVQVNVLNTQADQNH